MNHLVAAFSLVSVLPVAMADDLSVLPEMPGRPPASRMMTLYLNRQAERALAERAERLEQVKEPGQRDAYQQRVRDYFVEQIGGWPDRTPLNARVVGRLERDGYRVEKVIYESLPGVHVTALLFLPTSEGPYPGVLVPCGHSASGKGQDAYQRACILLARNGMAALCYDPIGQGERHQYLNENHKALFGATHEHTLVGVGCILLGTNVARFHIWDGIRGIDYLVSRDDIDAERIGCTGNSGGGTLTSYIGALDDRVQCTAPSCYLTTLDWIFDHIGPQDGEQNIHGQIAFGMEHADYLIARAPRPTLMCAATRDFFSIDATWDTYRQAKRFYGNSGFAERVDLVEADAEHGFSMPLRVGMVRWMRRWLLDIDDAVTEPDVAVLEEQDYTCTPKGHVLLMDGARSVFDVNAEQADQLAGRRRRLWKENSREEMLDRVRDIAGIRALQDLPKPQVTAADTIERDGRVIDKLVISPEPGIMLPALRFVPDGGAGGSCLYLHGDSKAADTEPGGPIDQLVRSGMVVLAVDLRGIGETLGTTKYDGWEKLFGRDWQDFFRAYLLGRSFVGMRAEDVLVCARYLAESDVHGSSKPVHLIAIGEAGPPALHAAVLEPGLFDTIRFDDCLSSWTDVVKTPVTHNRLINTVHGALKTYDLPELYGLLPGDRTEVNADSR